MLNVCWEKVLPSALAADWQPSGVSCVVGQSADDPHCPERMETKRAAATASDEDGVADGEAVPTIWPFPANAPFCVPVRNTHPPMEPK